MIWHIIISHEKAETYQLLERIIQQLDLSAFDNLPDLEAVCQSKFMVSALLYIFMGQGKDPKHQTSCMNILNTMYKILRQARILEK